MLIRMMYLIGALLFSSVIQAKTEVVFLSPGSSTESFWRDVDSVLAVAAAQFGFEVKTYHTNRNQFELLRLATEIAKLPSLPKYVVLVNEKQVGIKLLSAFYRKPVYVQFLIDDLDPKERSELVNDPHWREYLLPAIVPDNREIGSLTAKSLVAGLGKDEPAQVVLISGDKATPASVKRTEGAALALDSMEQVEVVQTVYGQWQESKAYSQVQILLNRYPKLVAIWAANDLMAFGAIRAIRDAGRRPGIDVRISSISTSPEVIAARLKGDIQVLGGGHCLAAGIALSNLKQHSLTGVYPNTLYPTFWLLNPGSEFFEALERRDWGFLLNLVLNKPLDEGRQTAQ